MAACRLILVADDYAISPAVSAGIRELAAQGRLSATGVMTTMPDWPAEAPALRALKERIAVGLHFTLTDQAPLGPLPRLAPGGRFPKVNRLLLMGLLGRIPEQEVADEFERQLDRFEAFFGAPPDFIDGHQHVHLFPGIWPVVHAAFGRRLDPSLCWLRDCWDPHFWRRGSQFKAGVIATLGRAASLAARTRGLRSNRGFSGFYDYEGGNLARNFAPMLRSAGDLHLMMVHPGHVDDALRAVDSLTDARQQEFDYLNSDRFPADLAALGFELLTDRTIPGHIAAL
jgi:predicted glycoside hydrolase/deacetylase ChbG (UPF0249 family)